MVGVLIEGSEGTPVTAFDLAVLFPLEMDAFPFGGLVRLLRDESFLSRLWFPSTEFSPEHVLLSLRRLLVSGLVQCHEDSALSSPPLASPNADLMRLYWYSLTPRGSEVIQARTPWYYDILEWSFHDSGGSLAAAVERLRTTPHRWLCASLHVRPTSLRGLPGWRTHLATLREIGGYAIVAHFVDRLNHGAPRLYRGHFRPVGDFQPLTRRQNDSKRDDLREETELSNLDLLVLDALQDDVESIPSILDMLSHPEFPHKAPQVTQSFVENALVGVLERLTEMGLVSSYREVNDEGRLESAPLFDGARAAGLWFALTAAGREVTERVSRGRFDLA